MKKSVIREVSLDRISVNAIYKLIYDFSCNILENLKLIQTINFNINQYGFIIDLLPPYLRNVNIVINENNDDSDGNGGVVNNNINTNFSSTRQIILLIKDIISISRRKGICRFINDTLSIDIPNIQQISDSTEQETTDIDLSIMSIMTIDISLYFDFLNNTTLITKKISEFYGPLYNTYDYIAKLQVLINDFENLKMLCSSMLTNV
jgi:hypothetical protein